MSFKQSTFIRPVSLISGLTLGSRILGLLRDSLLFASLGASGLNSAFLLAFTLPNLFRRLLGEGALTSALIPSLAAEAQKDCQATLNRFFNQVLTRLSILILGTLGVVMPGLLCVRYIPGLSERWYWAADMGLVLMPYLWLICLAAALSAALNVRQRFGWAAFSPIALNLAMIFALGAGFACDNGPKRAWILCAGVLVGGMVQLGMLVWACKQEHFCFRIDWGGSEALKNWKKRFIPGLWGASILQLNSVFSRFLAFGIDPSATAVLYLANRLIEFPLGVFSSAIVSVLFPRLSDQAAKDDVHGLAHTYTQGLRYSLGISIPAALGLIALSEPILLGLFQWGKFSNPLIAQGPLCLYAASIPFYSMSLLATRTLHALHEARLPARMAVMTLILHVLLSLLLLPGFKTSGLAAANLLSALFQSVALHLALCKKNPQIHPLSALQARLWLQALLMGVITYASWKLWAHLLPPSKLSLLGALVVLIPLGVGVYGVGVGKGKGRPRGASSPWIPY